MTARSFELARHIASWKRMLLRGWESIEVVSVVTPDSTQKPLDLGETFTAEIVLDMNELSGKDVGIDRKNRKLNYPLVAGINEAKRNLNQNVKRARDALNTFGERAKNCLSLCDMLEAS